MFSLLAQQFGGGVANWGIGQIAIAVIVVLAIIAIVYIFVQWQQIPVSPFVWRIIGIVIAAIVCIIAIKFLLSM